MSMHILLTEPSRVDEPAAAREYSDVLSQVASDGRPVIVRRNGEDLAAIVPLEHLELVREVLVKQNAHWPEPNLGLAQWRRGPALA